MREGWYTCNRKTGRTDEGRRGAWTNRRNNGGGGEAISGSRRPETAPPGEGPPEPRKSLSMQLSCFHPPLVRICLSFLGISAASLAQLRIAEGHQAFEEIPYTVLHCNPSFRFRWFASEQAAGLPDRCSDGDYSRPEGKILSAFCSLSAVPMAP